MKSIEITDTHYLNIEDLKAFYFVHSPSGFEHGIQGLIRYHLNKMGIEFFVDKHNQTYNLSNKNAPLICAHTDQVCSKALTKINIKDGIISGDSNLGADDKNGIWICLNLLSEYPDLNFIFSNREEQGGDVWKLLELKERCFDWIPFGLVFDRKGSSDIVGKNNEYCIKSFEQDLVHISEENNLGFKPCTGIFSDCDAISDYISCVNISCGYYKAHTDSEYTDIKALYNSLKFGKAIIESLYVDSVVYFDKPVKRIHRKELTLDYDRYLDRSKYKDIADDDDMLTLCPICGASLEDDDIEEFYCYTCQSDLYGLIDELYQDNWDDWDNSDHHKIEHDKHGSYYYHGWTKHYI